MARSRRRSTGGRRKGRPRAKPGRHVVWVKGHCRGRPASGYTKRERQRRSMPF